ncbi:MAG: DUF4886 domain-containing protein [Clostridia bacterium]|nr:DUF4886 domain-containing protein [Clostridia bacterium]
MNVLAIGNSFSQDTTRYLHAIARADGEKLNVANLYIGGCSLERHFRNMMTEAAEYELQFNGECTGFKVSLFEALTNRAWDIITVQQVSHQSFNKDSYFPYITELIDYVKSLVPKAKIYLHQTWGYEDGSARLATTPYATFGDMASDVIMTNAEVADEITADRIIPSGEMLLKLHEAGIAKIHRDTFHASLGIGRYALALIWYRALTGKSVLENTFADLDEEASDEEMKLARDCAESFAFE